MGLRNTLMILTLATLLGATGCKTQSVPDYLAPLENVKERSVGGDSFVTTFHTTVWVNDIEDYHKRNPIGSPSYNATMIHERIHSIRMGNIFTSSWFGLQYLFSTDFMWEEEQIGWYYQLRYMRKKGILKPAEHTATVLSRYENLFGYMISYKDALQWVRDVLNGRWKPDLSPEEMVEYAPPAETN